MQTSHEIHAYFSQPEDKQDTRNILVRVIGVAHTKDETETRNRIIKATNSQTSIQASTLRATDVIQRNIEDYLRSQGFYYDRRKNYYENEGKPLSKIISITYLAQCVISILLRRPNDARARPSSLLKEDANYATIFDPEHPMPLYVTCIQIVKRAESYLRNASPDWSPLDVNSFKFHLSMYSALLLANNPEAKAEHIANLKLNDFTDDLLKDCIVAVNEAYGADPNGASHAAKDKDNVSTLLKVLKKTTFTGA